MGNDNVFWTGMFVGVLLIAIVLLGGQDIQWSCATEVPMTVEIVTAGATEAVSVPCTGRIRYDRAGRIHIIGGIGPEIDY